MGLFGGSETLNFEVPQFVRTLRVVMRPISAPNSPTAEDIHPGVPLKGSIRVPLTFKGFL